MFEKEGIRYALEETIGTECLSKPIEDFHFIDLADEQQEKAQCWKDGAEFGYNKANEWHKLSEKYPEANKLIRVHCHSGMEHICETCYYKPTEDEIGYGKLITSFYELNGEWVDDNDVIAWCYTEPFKESE